MNMAAILRWFDPAHWPNRGRAAMRTLLSYYVLNGAMCAFGLFLISTVVHALFGEAAAAAAVVGVIATIPPDMAAPLRGKATHMAIAPLIGLPLFLAVQLLRAHPVELGLLLVPATFMSFLGMAWGKRGAPVAIAVMFSVVFSMSTPASANLAEALQRTGFFALGAALYVLYSVLSNTLCNARYRAQLIADLLLTMAALMRAQANRFAPKSADSAPLPEGGELSELLRRQAALADQLQNTRDIVLESPRTPRRQRLAGMLLAMLEMRDQLVASELDLDQVREDAGHHAVLHDVRQMLQQMAQDLAQLADALLTGRMPALPADHGARLAALRLDEQADTADHTDTEPGTPPNTGRAGLVRGLAYRLTHLNDGVQELGALARGEAKPDLTLVRNNWRLFVSPTDWSWRPFLSLWAWRAPALRHAIRAALAIGTGYTIAALLPWGSHEYWVLLTIVVVLRGSLAQTLERRDARVAGTVLGSLLAVGLLVMHPPSFVLLLSVTVAQGVAHGFAMRRYLITAVAASVLGLVQAHLLFAGTSPTFAFIERVGDTLLGAGLAWAFCYVLPSWERGQLASLVRRNLTAQAQHVRMALGVSALHDIDTQPELAWRLARREAYDSLSALVLATERSLAEPRAVRPPIALLEHMQAHGYQLLAQLSAAKSMLLLRRDQLRLDEIEIPLMHAASRIEQILTGEAGSSTPMPPSLAANMPTSIEALPDPFENDISPWLIRRLELAMDLARKMRSDADQALEQLTSSKARS
ncbi:FUSC family protein [Ottowia thiooxydans]|uniref:FUSC family protein n=1 Tax=Ottowia thiooxydans TaxID=219182 RepID=UPI000419ABD9|nr:FUSC family membrane protein [Ottowia thiooxydans]